MFEPNAPDCEWFPTQDTTRGPDRNEPEVDIGSN